MHRLQASSGLTNDNMWPLSHCEDKSCAIHPAVKLLIIESEQPYQTPCNISLYLQLQQRRIHADKSLQCLTSSTLMPMNTVLLASLNISETYQVQADCPASWSVCSDHDNQTDSIQLRFGQFGSIWQQAGPGTSAHGFHEQGVAELHKLTVKLRVCKKETNPVCRNCLAMHEQSASGIALQAPSVQAQIARWVARCMLSILLLILQILGHGYHGQK